MEHFILLRETEDGTIEGIRFNRAILGRMDITESEWKPVPGNIDPRLREYLNTGRG